MAEPALGVASADALATLRRLVNGYQVTQAIHVLARLGIPDRLAAGPRSASELAAEVGANEPSLYRLLRALASVGVLEELPERRFALTELSQPLRSDAPVSLAGWASFVGRPYYWNAWARLIDSVKTGAVGFKLEHGVDVWEYRQARPEEVAIFNQAMNSSSSAISRSVVARYDFSNAQTVVDVGGGGGLLLTEILNANPEAKGILFDLPKTVEHAKAFIAAAGLAERIELVPGDFFQAVPAAADLYVLKSILHDWYDEDAARILTSVRRAARADSVLIVVEAVLAGPNEGWLAKFADLNMLVGAGGRERTHEEWDQLLAAGGWRLDEVRPVGTAALLIARPA